VRAALLETVEMHMMCDVPIGAFLSGGVVSTGSSLLCSGFRANPPDLYRRLRRAPRQRPDVKFTSIGAMRRQRRKRSH